MPAMKSIKKYTSGSLLEQSVGTPIDFFSRLRGIVIIVPECILRGSQARKSAFWVDCTFKNIVNMGLAPKISLRFTQELAYLAL